MRELFGLNETNSKKSTSGKREFSNKHVLRGGLKQRHAKDTSKVMSSKSHKHGIDPGGSTTNQELLIVDKPQLAAATNTLDSEQIEEFFSITNTNVKDVRKPQDAILETFDPLNS